MTLQEAKELAIKKWEWIVKNGGDYNNEDLEYDIPELIDFLCHCSYCELFYYNNCKGCPLNIKGLTCKNEDDIEHPFNIWESCRTKENAQKVLDLIKSIEV